MSVPINFTPILASDELLEDLRLTEEIHAAIVEYLMAHDTTLVIPPPKTLTTFPPARMAKPVLGICAKDAV